MVAESYPTNTTNPLLNPRMYWQVSAIALAATAFLGIVVNLFAGNNSGVSNFLVFDWSHNVLHVVLAAAAFVVGFTNIPGQVAKIFAIIFGVIYTSLAIVGFIGGLSYDLFGLNLIGLEIGENLVHLLIGGWALTSGVAARY